MSIYKSSSINVTLGDEYGYIFLYPSGYHDIYYDLMIPWREQWYPSECIISHVTSCIISREKVETRYN